MLGLTIWRRAKLGLLFSPSFGFSLFKLEEKIRNQGMEFMFGTLIFVSLELLYGILVRKVWIYWLGNPPNSIFAYVCVRRTLSLYKCDFCWC